MASANQSPGRQPISPEKRRRLQQMFEHGSRAGAGGNYDYATELFGQCVLGDPGNKLYAQSLLGNLQKKYNNNKKGSKLAAITGAGQRGMLKKAQVQKDWPGVIRAGLELLKLNPWDVNALTGMAAACESSENDDTQVVYLRGALEADIKNIDVNRLLARALGRQAQFDQAILCWKRVQQAAPQDEEALRAIADLTVERTIKHGGYEEAESSTEVRADRDDDALEAGVATPERQLEKLIAKDPADVSNYLRLAELHLHKERVAEGEEVLQRAIAVSPGDFNLRERLEDLQLRRQREQLDIAKKRAESERTAESIDLYKRMKAELNLAELEVYRNRSDRYPSNLIYRYELALRLQRAGNFNEAIKQYQEARQDPQRKGLVMLALGECFLQIKQYKLAMRNLEAAVQEIPERELEAKKRALYQAGALAMALKEWGPAENYLTELAGLDYGYKDVSERLDKIGQLRDKG